ncbi:uncharacterized protein METZ01_LOCUS499122 [marine metagenome]|uniref:Pyrroline-5-carboxylate reductase catalytic N-terminal domain-containing protein n=1 Tax=marine metagenome TaxID=408172 RepID=A0A383DR03_9ZZZZ
MIGFIGGTGPEGRSLARRFALSGQKVIVGSRSKARADAAVAKIVTRAPSSLVTAALNAEAAQMGEVVFVVVPYTAQRSILEPLANQLAGKIVVNAVAPVTVSGGMASAVEIPEGSAALQAQSILPRSEVVAAFHTISANDLWRTEDPIESDVVVCANDRDARDTVFGLVESIPRLRAIDGGGLENATYVERFTALLLNINRRYKAHSAIRIVGI